VDILHTSPQQKAVHKFIHLLVVFPRVEEYSAAAQVKMSEEASDVKTHQYHFLYSVRKQKNTEQK